MNIIGIITRDDPDEQWLSWIAALDGLGFGVKRIDCARIGAHSSGLGLVDTFLLDGFLTQLSSVIMRIRVACPVAKIIVATAKSSYSIYYETMQLGASYIAQLESPQDFARIIRNIIPGNTSKESYLLPNWISHR